MNEELFLKKIKEDLKIELSEQAINSLQKYCTFLLEYNKHTNLTAIKNPEEVYLKHFYDSLTLNRVIELQKKQRILDIGTGAGFPGLVLAICFPNLEVELLDSNNKKITFLNEMIEKLQIKNAKTIYTRTEEFAKQISEKYDVITSRAVAELRILIETSFSLLKVNGYFIAMKSKIEEELKNAEGILHHIFGNIEQIDTFHLPLDSGKRSIIKIQKTQQTPRIYPRAYATILKKTLKKQ